MNIITAVKIAKEETINRKLKNVEQELRELFAMIGDEEMKQLSEADTFDERSFMLRYYKLMNRFDPPKYSS